MSMCLNFGQLLCPTPSLPVSEHDVRVHVYKSWTKSLCPVNVIASLTHTHNFMVSFLMDFATHHDFLFYLSFYGFCNFIIPNF